MIDNSMTGTFQIDLPKDLLSESKRAAKPKNEQLHVEGWRNSWLSRISELLVGKDWRQAPRCPPWAPAGSDRRPAGAGAISRI
jgi:hypothetical protein